jgi:hypothetical protein
MEEHREGPHEHSRQTPRPDQEGFGEASLGEAQGENPPPDPEMIRGEDGEGAGSRDGDDEGDESYGGDQDAEPASQPDDADRERDQAEG